MKPAFMVTLAITSSAGPAFAQELDSYDDSGSITRPLELEIGGELTVLTRNVRHEDGDSVGFTTPTYRGFHFAPRYRMSAAWSVGALGAIGWSPQATHGISSTMWHVLGEGRWHPWREAVNPWAGALLGASARVATSEDGASTTHYAPSAGLSLGVDLGVSDSVVLDVITRGLYTGSEDQDDGRGVWIWLGVGMEARPGFSRSPRAAHR